MKIEAPTTVITRDAEMKLDESNPLLARTVNKAKVKAVNIAKIELTITLL
jgi:hypothetical protein